MSHTPDISPSPTQKHFFVKAVFFDLDGTLADTAQDISAAINAMLQDMDCPTLAHETISQAIGTGAQALVHNCLKHSAPDKNINGKEALLSFQKHYRLTNGRHTRLFPEVIDALQQLQKKNIHLACITNKPAAFTEPLLRKLDIHCYFSLVICGDSLDEKKPHPLPLQHACHFFGCEPQQALMIGDSINDIAAARAAGCPIICVPYGYNEGHPINPTECDEISVSLLTTCQQIHAAL
jgi:phosphoglycolate phosphatase